MTATTNFGRCFFGCVWRIRAKIISSENGLLDGVPGRDCRGSCVSGKRQNRLYDQPDPDRIQRLWAGDSGIW